MVNFRINNFRKGKLLLISLAGIILLRMISNSWLAIYDPTESRYAEIANQMYRSGNWLTPKVYVDGRLVPYWGKPPLHFWLTAGAFKVFGVSEWSARLPSLLAGIFMLCMTMYFVRRVWGARTALVTGIIQSSTLLFFILWGSSVVDVTLSAAVTSSMISFALAIVDQRVPARRFWSYVFFASLAVGILTKGLIAVALVSLSIGLWLLFTKDWKAMKSIPWFSGTAILLIITTPWFVLAEKATPGFLRYFFINEHFLRYLVHNYGDKYGSGHVYFRGSAWGMLLLGFFPWTFFLIGSLVSEYKAHSGNPEKKNPNDAWLKYALI